MARSLAFGAKDLAVNAPALLIDPDGRALLRALTGCFGVRVRLLVGDTDLMAPTERGPRPEVRVHYLDRPAHLP